jgi:hypothetical protein
VSLRYQIIYSASRSAVRDCVLSCAVAAYPLFKRGVEQERFSRAVLLLSRDVEQLLAARGITPPNSNGGSGETGEIGGILIRLQYLMAHCAAQADSVAADSVAECDDKSSSSEQQEQQQPRDGDV